MSRLRPLHDNIVVRRNEPEKQLESGLYIPDTAAEKPMEGEVVAVGTGKVMGDGSVVPVTVKIGDKVVFTQNSGQEFQLGDETFLIMHESDIIARVEV